MSRAPRRPRDTNQLAKFIVDLSTGEAADNDPHAGKDPAAIERGRLGGLKGGKARANALPRSQRLAIAKQAARTRWKKGAKKGE
jgi:hypothetical protein